MGRYGQVFFFRKFIFCCAVWRGHAGDFRKQAEKQHAGCGGAAVIFRADCGGAAVIFRADCGGAAVIFRADCGGAEKCGDSAEKSLPEHRTKALTKTRFYTIITSILSSIN